LIVVRGISVNCVEPVTFNADPAYCDAALVEREPTRITG
jgi:hypothetical protein